MATTVTHATASAAHAWPPPRAFMTEQPTIPAQFTMLNELLPITLTDREIMFVSGATFSTKDPLGKEHDAATTSYMWEPSAIRTLLANLSRIKGSDECVLVVLTDRTGQQLTQTAAPFLGWSAANHGRSHSSNVRSMTLLHTVDDEPVCTPLLRGSGTPSRTMFDGQMDVILPSAEFVGQRSVGAFIESFGAPPARTHELRASASGTLI